jgi:sRNA-binding regulator protein Hfq
MRLLFVGVFFFASLMTLAQDKIYLLNGQLLTGKVTEIEDVMIKYRVDGEEQVIGRQYVMLIEFKSGQVEMMTPPETESVYMPEGIDNRRLSDNSKKLEKNNSISLNSLALCNSDVSVFYEKLLLKQFGVGVMGAYNFNTVSSYLNSNISVLGNAKKNYDLGCYANLYLTDNRGFTIYGGMLFKYTSLSFSKTNVTQTYSGTGSAQSVNYSYTPAEGYQFSSFFTMGTKHVIRDNFFMSTMAGLGGFNLHGDYKYQYNFKANENRDPRKQPVSYGFLLKVYFGVNIGMSF